MLLSAINEVINGPELIRNVPSYNVLLSRFEYAMITSSKGLPIVENESHVDVVKLL